MGKDGEPRALRCKLHADVLREAELLTAASVQEVRCVGYQRFGITYRLYR